MSDQHKSEIDERIIRDCLVLLTDLAQCGEWYESAIEIDTYEKGSGGEPLSGSELESRIDEMVLRICQRNDMYESESNEKQ